MVRSALKNVARRMLGFARPTPVEQPVHGPPTTQAPPRRAAAPEPDPEPQVEVSARLVARWVTEGKDPLFVDVRECTELMTGYPEGASLIPMNQVPMHLDALPHDRPSWRGRGDAGGAGG